MAADHVRRLFSAIKRGLKSMFTAVRQFDHNMRRHYHPERLAIAATIVLAAGMILQLFVPPYLGVSNDGSFDAIMRETGLSDANPGHEENYFMYYNRTYIRTERQDTGGSTPWLLRLFVHAAIFLDALFTPDGIFDMRWLAALYGVCYLGVAYLLMRNLLARTRAYSEGMILATACVLIMGDTAVVTRFASLYTQPLEWILLIGIVDGIFLVSHQRSRGVGAAFLFGSVCMLMNVNRYAALAGLVFSMAYWRLAGLRNGGLGRVVFILMAVALSLMSVFRSAEMVNGQTDAQKYNQMTRGVLFEAVNPEEALAEFGIEPRYSILTETYADQSFPAALMDAKALHEGFFDHYSTTDVAIYYLRHPMALLGMLDVGVHSSFASRPSYSGNFEKSAGLPPMAKSPFPALWSTFKEQSAPKTIGSLFILLMVIALLRRRRKTPAQEWVELSRSLLNVVLAFSLVELLTVLTMSGDSELVREGFMMGTSVDVLVMVFLTEILHKTKAIGHEEVQG